MTPCDIDIQNTVDLMTQYDLRFMKEDKSNDTIQFEIYEIR